MEVKTILHEIKKANGTAYLVGGSVRDLVLGREIKDFDIEIHGLSFECIRKILGKFGHVYLRGRSFGVLRIKGFDVDWSVPRRDSKGRKPIVELDPFMTIEEACKRRDLTMNAMAIDVTEFAEKLNHDLEQKIINMSISKGFPFKIIDHYGGLQDIVSKRLRAVDKKLFIEDPLRFFRVMQFIGRFEFWPDSELNSVCSSMSLKDPVTNENISKERIFEELKKLFLLSRRPSLGFWWLRDIGRLKEVFPEVFMLVGVKQRADYHPEGDVFAHTMQSLDAAADYQEYKSVKEKFWIMLAVLCHDMGKPVTVDEHLHCYGHEVAGVDIAKRFLKRITNNKELISFVSKLVLYHLRPAQLLAQDVSVKAYKRLAAKLAPEVNMRQLSLVTLADLRGRNGESQLPLKEPQLAEKFLLFLKRIKNAEVEEGPEQPILKGRDFLDIVQPGKEVGELVDIAYQIQIEEGLRDRKILKAKTLAVWESRCKKKK